MSDYRDIVKTAIEKGFYLDSCGSEERYYTWGSWIDLCGMSIEEAMSGLDDGQGGGSGSKKKNTVTFSMKQGSDGEYSLYVTAAYAPNSDVTVSFTVDNEQQTVVIPAGTTTVNTGIKGENGQKPYAVITNITVTSEDEGYSYTPKNTVKTGIFTLKMTKNGVETTDQVKYGTEIQLESPAEKEGYDFVWKDGDGNTITGNTFTMPEKDTTITGTYVIKSYSLTYTIKQETLNGSDIETQTLSSKTVTVKYNDSVWNVIKNLTPAKQGYTLVGWTSNGTAVNSSTKMPASDFAVENTYKLNTYKITYKADGVVVEEQTLYFGQAIEVLTPPSKIGYTTIGWSATIPATMPASNITVNAVYEAIKYYIRYSVDGTEKYVEEHIYGDAISIRPDETKEGNTFSGWNPSTLPATMPAEDIAVSGTFSVNSYTLTYKVYVNGVEEGAGTAVTVEYDTEISPIELPAEREGYTRNNEWIGMPSRMPARDVEVHCEFTVNDYTLTFMSDGVVYDTITGAYGSVVPEVVEPTKEGHTFTGWDNAIPATIPATDMTFDAQFSVNSYVLSYYVDGGLVESAMTEYGAQIVLIDEPVEEGYTFSGWDNVYSTMPAFDVDIHGTFTINKHTLAFYINNNEVSSSTVEYNTALTVPESPEEIGHTFSGWTAMPATMPDNDVRVDGWFIVNQYTLTFNIDGQFYTSITQDYNTQVTAPVPEHVTGYTFGGWGDVPATMPAENMTFNGTYNINSWTATYYIDNNEHSTQVYQYGATIDYPSVTPPDGYTLKWTKEYLTMPDYDIRIDGVFEEHVAPKTIYYGMVLSGEENRVDPDNLDSFDYEDGVEVTAAFVIPADLDYDELETDEEFAEWDETHMFNYYLLVPEGKQLTFKNAKGNVKTMNPKGTRVINEENYTMYYSPATTQTSESSTFNMKITITEN